MSEKQRMNAQESLCAHSQPLRVAFWVHCALTHGAHAATRGTRRHINCHVVAADEVLAAWRAAEI